MSEYLAGPEVMENRDSNNEIPLENKNKAYFKFIIE